MKPAIDRQTPDSRVLKGASVASRLQPRLASVTYDPIQRLSLAFETRDMLPVARWISLATRAMLANSLRPPGGSQYTVSISSEIVGDSLQYGADFIAAFHQAGDWTVSDFNVMTGNRPPSGIGISFPDAKNPSPEARLVMAALKAARIAFDVRLEPFQPNSTSNVDILISPKIDH